MWRPTPIIDPLITKLQLLLDDLRGSTTHTHRNRTIRGVVIVI